ncbi:glycosyltransferase family protein [Stutzerimonas nitrititolerans]|uniref:glycosyltransferase family protein n=1 Tax=Stutzerimonas nitrititolerans TaxID=2482751 RepID=UPI00289EBC22|nr:glycosyltransferase [Stutzerimonas nitrititolerans]
MRLLVLTASPRTPDIATALERLALLANAEIHVLDKKQQANLRPYLAPRELVRFDRVLLDVPFKRLRRQAALLSSISGLLIYEEDACQNYLDSSKWKGAFSRFYRALPGARIIVTGASVAGRLRKECLDVTFLPKGYDPRSIFNEGLCRDIELGFVGRTASAAYGGRKALLDRLAKHEPLRLLRAEPGDDYRRLLNRIRFFISADVGLGEYMAKNFEAMACGCLLFAFRQGEEEEAIGLRDGEHLILYSSLDELRSRLSWARSNPEAARDIAEAGRLFVERSLNHEVLGERLYSELSKPWPAFSELSFWARFRARFLI